MVRLDAGEGRTARSGRRGVPSRRCFGGGERGGGALGGLSHSDPAFWSAKLSSRADQSLFISFLFLCLFLFKTAFAARVTRIPASKGFQLTLIIAGAGKCATIERTKSDSGSNNSMRKNTRKRCQCQKKDKCVAEKRKERAASSYGI